MLEVMRELIPDARDHGVTGGAGAVFQDVVEDGGADPLDQQGLAVWAVGILVITDATGKVAGIDVAKSGPLPDLGRHRAHGNRDLHAPAPESLSRTSCRHRS
jgi:hypothetical protein